MAFEVYTYSPSEIVLLLSGYRITGFDSITIARPKSFKVVKGIRGVNSRIRNRDTGCVINIDLVQTSMANDVLSRLVDIDLTFNSGRINLDLTDNAGSSKISSTDCFVDGYPETIYTDDIVYRRWSLVCLSTSIFKIGGNSRLANQLFDTSLTDTISSVSDNISDLF